MEGTLGEWEPRSGSVTAPRPVTDSVPRLHSLEVSRLILDLSAARRRTLLVLCAVAAGGCPALQSDDTPGDGTGDGTGDASESGDGPGTDAESSAADVSGGPAGDDVDPGTDDTGDADSGSDPSALDDAVFFFVRDTQDGDSLWAYDLGTDQAHEVTALDGISDIRSVAIHPDRTVVAIASDYGGIDHQDSEAIYAFEVNDDLVFGEPTLLMPPLPKPVGVATGYKQQLSSLRWHPDGAWLWFSHAYQLDFSEPGGGTLAGVDPTTGTHELYLDSIGDCIVNTAPSPSPDGSVLLSVRGVCIDGAHEGLVAFDNPPAGDPDVVVPLPDALFATPRWLPDGTGIIYGTKLDGDGDGDGVADFYTDAIVLLDVATGDQYALLPPTADVFVWDFTISPTADRVVVCVSQNDTRDLLLLDFSGAEATSRWLTDDGGSCTPSW